MAKFLVASLPREERRAGLALPGRHRMAGVTLRLLVRDRNSSSLKVSYPWGGGWSALLCSWTVSWAAAQTTDIQLGITDHDGPLRRSNPESEPFLILGFCCSPEAGDPVAERRFWRLALCLLKLRLLYIIPWTQQRKDLSPLSPLSPLLYLLTCLSIVPAPLCFSTFSTSVS